METVLKIAVNLIKNFMHQKQLENHDFMSEIRTDNSDAKLDELVYILVNLSETPGKYSKYFTQAIVFKLESNGMSIIKHFVNIIKDLDQNVLQKLINLCFKEDQDKYQMFSILFKLLRMSEENEVFKSDSDIGSQKSSDMQGSLLATLDDHKLIIRALLLALYKSSTRVDNLVVISKLFFTMFLPYAFSDKNSDVVKKVETEIQEIDSEPLENDQDVSVYQFLCDFRARMFTRILYRNF